MYSSSSSSKEDEGSSQEHSDQAGSNKNNSSKKETPKNPDNSSPNAGNVRIRNQRQSPRAYPPALVTPPRPQPQPRSDRSPAPASLALVPVVSSSPPDNFDRRLVVPRPPPRALRERTSRISEGPGPAFPPRGLLVTACRDQTVLIGGGRTITYSGQTVVLNGGLAMDPRNGNHNYGYNPPNNFGGHPPYQGQGQGYPGNHNMIGQHQNPNAPGVGQGQWGGYQPQPQPQMQAAPYSNGQMQQGGGGGGGFGISISQNSATNFYFATPGTYDVNLHPMQQQQQQHGFSGGNGNNGNGGGPGSQPGQSFQAQAQQNQHQHDARGLFYLNAGGNAFAAVPVGFASSPGSSVADIASSSSGGTGPDANRRYSSQPLPGRFGQGQGNCPLHSSYLNRGPSFDSNSSISARTQSLSLSQGSLRSLDNYDDFLNNEDEENLDLALAGALIKPSSFLPANNYRDY